MTFTVSALFIGALTALFSFKAYERVPFKNKELKGASEMFLVVLGFVGISTILWAVIDILKH